MATRKNPEKHREQVRAANRARYRAVQILITENQARFDTLYAAQAALEGVTPDPRKHLDAVGIQTQIKQLEKRLGQITSESTA